MAETEDPPTQTEERAQRPVRRGCFGTIVSGGCGCFAFLFGAGAAIALFAPQLLSGWGARVLENVIESRIDGRARVDGLYLSWRSKQNAKQVDIFAPGNDDKPVLTGSIDFPSILSILGSDEGQRSYEIRVERFEAQLDAEGSSDLARVLGADSEASGSVVRRLYGLAKEFVGNRRASGDDRSARVAVRIVEGVFKPHDPVEDEVVIEKLEVVADNYRREPWVEIGKGTITWAGSGEGASVALKATFGRDDRDADVVDTMNAAIDPIPVDVLRTLGVLDRRPETRQFSPALGRRVNVFDTVAPALLDWSRAYASTGVGIDLEYEAPVVAGEDAEIGPTPRSGRLELELTGEMGEVSLVADVSRETSAPIDRWIVSGDAPVGRPSPLRFDLAPARAMEARFIGALLPDAIAVEEHGLGDDARIWGAARSFRIQLPVGAFGDSRLDQNGLLIDPASQLADIVRRASIDLRFASRRAKAPRVLLSLADVGRSSGESARGAGSVSRNPFEELELVHHVTTLELVYPLGGTLRTDWGTEMRPDSTVSVHLGGAGLSSGDVARGTMDIAFARVPRSFIAASRDVPKLVLGALPARVERVELTGLPLGLALGVQVPVEADVRVRTIDGESIEGHFEDGVFRCLRAQFDLPLDQASSREVLMYLMPWLAEVEARDQAEIQLGVVLEEFEFRFLGETDEDSGMVYVDCPPLRVRLAPKLASRLGRDARERAGGWLDWDPAPMRIRLDRLNMFYEAMEVPLPGGGVAAVTGNAIGREYSLAGEYPGSYVAENLAPDRMFSAELNSNRGAPRLSLDPIDLKVTDIARIIQDELMRVFLMQEKEGGE